MNKHEKLNNQIPTGNAKSWTVKDWAKAIIEERKTYPEAKIFLGPSKVHELLKEISELDGVPAYDLDDPESLKQFEDSFRNDNN